MLLRPDMKRVFNPKYLNVETVFSRRKHQQAIAERVARYPAIFDTSVEGYERYQRQLWYDSVKDVATVEQKLYEITCRRSFYERTYMVKSCSETYVGVPFQQYITRTHLVQGLTDQLNEQNVDEELFALKSEMSDLVSTYFSNTWRRSKHDSLSGFTEDKNVGANLANAIISLICRKCAVRHPHLLEHAFDPWPWIHSYWFHDGFISKKDKLNEKNLCFQFKDEPAYTVRSNKPLPVVVQPNDPLCATAEVIDYNYQPNVVGIPYDRYYITSLPGFWPGECCDFPLLQVHTSDKIEILSRKLDHYELKPIEDGFGVMASFGWLNAFATYQGFTVYHDLTYPIVGQTILTNGQDWTFFVYQLNTMCFHSDLDKKDKRNICWTSGKMRLFETIEDGELKGTNEDVFKILMKFVLAKPEDREGINLKPYLGTDIRSEEEIVEMRKAAFKMYRNVKSLSFPQGEVPLWQHVYKRHKDAPPSPWTKLE